MRLNWTIRFSFENIIFYKVLHIFYQCLEFTKIYEVLHMTEGNVFAC